MAAPTGRHMRTEMFRYFSSPITIALDTAANIANCTEIDIRGFTYGSVHISVATLTSTALNYFGCHTSGGTFVAISGNAGTPLTSVIDSDAAQVIEIPAPVFSCPFIKITCGADAAAATVWLTS